MFRAACALIVSLAFALALASPGPLGAQAPTPVPTLAVPTLVPPLAEAASADALSNESALAEIIADGVMRVGILYNAPPYSELTMQGELRGFVVDLLRLIAEAWSIEIKFLQVTRLNALDRLKSGRVHAVATALVRYRDLDEEVDFTQTYLQGAQSLLVQSGSDFASPSDLRGRSLGYVIGARTEKALSLSAARLPEEAQLGHFLTLDRAVAALARGEVDGVVAEEQALRRAIAEQPAAFRILEEAVLREARAFAVRRQDAPLRNALNRAIQLLTRNRDLAVLHREYFPDEEFPSDMIALWDGIGDSITLADMPSAVVYPSRYTVPRILSSGVLRVGGIIGAEEDLPAGQRRMNQLNRALVMELAARWGVGVEWKAGAADAALELLERGDVDLVAGLKPDWNRAQALDFSMPYLLHGDRLMVRVNSGIEGFNNLRGRILGLLINDDTAQDRAQAWADTINASLRFFRTTEAGAALTLLEFNNAHAIYADSLALIPHLEANPNALRFTERWYSRSYFVFGTAENDPDMRLLVDYTLQEMIADGTLYRLTAPLTAADELPGFDIIPGAAAFAGINLFRSSGP